MQTINRKGIADRLKAERQKRGATRDQVAEAVGVALSTLAMYEQGRRVPNDENKVKLAHYYKTSVQDLFC